MGVWSSIRNSNRKQFLNVNPDDFSNTVHQDVKEFRIQESIPEISAEIYLPNGGDEGEQRCRPSFEYSMGGNLKVYKEHLKQDYFKTKISQVHCLRREKKISHSDNDSDPEALRYSGKCQAPSNDDIITEEHDVELSFDDYSTIYEPEFLFDIKSQPSMAKKTVNETLETRKTNKTRDERKGDNNITAFEKELLPRSKEALHDVYDIKKQSVFGYYSAIIEQETTEKQDAIISQNELVTKKKEIGNCETEKKCEVRKSSKISKKKKGEENMFSKNILEASQSILMNVGENCKANFSLRLHKHVEDICDDTSCDAERKNKNNVEEDATEFYPESPIAELSFCRTPCSTRHNSLEILTDTKENSEESRNYRKKQLKQLDDHPSSSNVQLQENYNKLPKEFQEMARRLSKEDEFPRSRPSLYQVSSNFNCSSSTCSTISPRSPNARSISRTPSYKMPKTPSLSRHHPATYVTQHTSSRSRPSSRASSRATSPTRENHERSSIKDFIELVHIKERRWKPT